MSKEERPVAGEFLKIYEPYKYQGTLEGNRSEARYLRKRTEECRFCKKRRVETTFGQETHLISRLIGNNLFYSHDECNECNELFNTFETDLAASLGAERTFNHLHPTEKAPGFESGNRNIGIKKLANENVILHTKKENSNDIKIDFALGKAEISMLTQPYRLEFVYRAILKMALAVLPAEDIANYDLAFKFLLNPEAYPELDTFKKAIVTETTIVLARPFVQLYKRKSGVHQSCYTEHVFCLYTGYFMFQLSIPGYIEDDSLVNNTPSNLAAPYYLLNTKDTHDDVIVSRSVQDLNSNEIIKRDISLHTEFSTANLVAIDLGKDILKSLLEK
ncbi:MAG TPA: hypothetical protein VG367_09210 [Mucilaginibacter sp.]|jgi:hypothetical protein|nr:hypothetical protein [Mucilaginibacter sp.]